MVMLVYNTTLYLNSFHFRYQPIYIYISIYMQYFILVTIKVWLYME